MPKQYGRWKVVSELGAGGQGQTFRAVEITSDGQEGKDTFVLKLLKHREQLERFRDEIFACQKLTHPHILRIIDQDLDGAEPYLVSEFCAGGALNDIQVTAYSIVDRLRMFSAICRAVAHAHANKPQIIHRDLKPKNIFLREDRHTPVVGDSLKSFEDFHV